MKIIVDGSIFELDGRGIAKSTIGLYRNVVKFFPETEIYIIQTKDFVCEFDVPGAKKIIVNSLSEALENVKKIKPDLLHFPNNGNRIEYFKNCKTKKLVTIHDIIPAMVPQFFYMSETDVTNYIDKVKQKIKLSDMVATCSKASKYDIAQFCGFPNSHVVYWGPFLSNKKKYKNKYGKYFLYNGGYDHRKGIEVLIDNFLQLKFLGILDANLVLTGKYSNVCEKLKPLIEYGKQRGWIIDLGYVSDEELIGLFQNALALCYLSAYEGFGMPPLEALSQGCPVITCNNSSLPEVVGSAAIFVDRSDDESVQKALISMEKDTKLRDEIIEKGKKQADKFTWENTVKQFMNMIKKEI